MGTTRSYAAMEANEPTGHFPSTGRGVRAQYQLSMAIAFWQARSMGWKQA